MKIATKDSSKPTVKKYHDADDSIQIQFPIITTDSSNSADTKAALIVSNKIATKDSSKPTVKKYHWFCSSAFRESIVARLG